MPRKPYRPRVAGPLAPYSEEYCEYVKDLGYTEHSACWQVWVMARLSQWMEVAQVGLESLTDDQIDRFVARHRSSKYKQPIGRRRLAPLLHYLRSKGRIPEMAPPARPPSELLMQQYQQFLRHRRHLAPRTIDGHVRTARRFLAPHVDGVELIQGLAALEPRDVTSFLLQESERLSPAATKNVLQQLRSLLRFCHQAGYLLRDIAVALPPVASWHVTRLPPIVPPNDIEALLHTDDNGNTPAPRRRDTAIVLLLARLGLRANEVCQLTLDDLDWRAGEIVVHGKGRQVDRRPLPPDVGQAIVDYLQYERPSTTGRQLFLSHRAPIHGMTRSGVSYVVRTTCQSRGLPPLGPHRLRHALATALLQRGATLPVIGQVLRHRDLQSTAVYAKIDRLALETVTQPWPEVSPS